MSRGADVRRRRANAEAQLASCGRVEDVEDEWQDEEERLRDENARLRDQLAEVEGWYGLLQRDHAALRDNDRRTNLRTTELQAELNRLEAENEELRARTDRVDEAGRMNQREQEESSMIRNGNLLRDARRHKWAAAAIITIATLLARDGAVQGLAARAIARARQLADRGNDPAREAADSGYVRYAVLLQSRDQLEQARKAYNQGEGQLKGDALLEAQDRLRAARARDRQARLAFLPELARRCEQAGVALPREAAEALATLKGESGE